MIKLKQKVAVVTGASRGLGYQVAKLLAKKDIHIVGLARTVGGLETLSDEIIDTNGSITIVPVDLQEDRALDNLAIKIFERWKKIDILVHCAVIASPMSPVTALSLTDFEKSISVNARVTIKLIQSLDPLLRQSETKTALFIDDTHSGKFMSSYSASKAASREIVLNYQEESKRIGARVKLFSPLPMPTALRARFFPGENQKTLSTCVSQAEEVILKLKL